MRPDARTIPAGTKSETARRAKRATDTLRKAQAFRARRGLWRGSECLVLGFTAFLLLLIWGALAYQIQHDRAAVIEIAQVNTRNMARAYAEHVAGALDLVDQSLLRVKDEYENASASPEFLRRLMADTHIDARAIPIGITDAAGHIVASNLGVIGQTKPAPGVPAPSMYAGDRDYFRALENDRSGGIYVSAPLTSRITGRISIALSRRLNKPDGSFAGVVFASFDPEYLTGFFGDLTIGKRSCFAILGRDMIIRDMIRGRGRASELVGKAVPRPELARAVMRSENGDYEAVSENDGIARLYSYRVVPKYQLIVLASAAKPDILAAYDQRRAWTLGAGVAVSLILILVAAFQLRRLRETRRYDVALNRSNERLARAQRLAAVGWFEHDVVTGKAEWSDEMFHILGIEKTAAVPGPETLIPLIHPDDRQRLKEHRAEELAGRQTSPLEYRIIRPDGAERIVRRENAIELDDAGRPVRRYGTLQDITELRVAEHRERELERQLFHSQKLEALGTLAGGMAHDLNNTLTPIMALSKLTARRLEPDSEHRRNLETIFAASEQARDLVRRVLSFSRREKAEKIEVNPATVVDDALSLLRATIPSSIHLISHLEEVPPIFADSSQIHQVVTNLVTNAAQAIEGSAGSITVLLERAPPTGHGDEIRLSVIDDGKGIDEATQRRIFEPFFTTKDVGQGTGLGLSIIESIVSDHGGRIELSSAPGRGTRFDVYFPLAQSRPAAAVSPAAA